MSGLSKGFSDLSIASTSQEHQVKVEKRTLGVTLLSSEWRSSTDGDVSTINRELAIQLAKHPNVQVSVFLPQCSEEDKRIAAYHNVQLIEAEEVPGIDPVDWLINIPENHVMDCIVGYGVRLGRQIPLIKKFHCHCKWIQVVHTAPEELGMYKSISEGEQMQQIEIELCEKADQVVAIGPKLADAYKRYLRSGKKDQDVLDLTPSIFTEFFDVQQATEERETFCVLVIMSGESEDFNLKGYDLAAQAIAELKDKSCHLRFICAPTGKGDKMAERLLEHGIARNQLIVRRFNESREVLARLFCEVDLAIMPSRTEGFGLIALEALSAGLPVLVSGNSGLGKALRKVPTGSACVVDSEDPKDWAKEIKAVRQKDRDVRLAESKNLREKYLEKYSWQKPCGFLVKKMQDLVFGSPGLVPSSVEYSQMPSNVTIQTYHGPHNTQNSSQNRPTSTEKGKRPLTLYGAQPSKRFREELTDHDQQGSPGCLPLSMKNSHWPSSSVKSQTYEGPSYQRSHIQIKQGTPTDNELEVLGAKIERKWIKLGRRLGIKDEMLQEICQAHDELSERGYYMLKNWKQKQGSDATYKALCEALGHDLVERQDLAEQFCYIKKELQNECKEEKGNFDDKLREVEDKIRNDIEQLNEKLLAHMAEMEGSSSKDKDEIRDDLKQMKSEIQNISEKLNSKMSQREETTDDENTRGNLEQMKVEIGNINEKLESLMNQLPPVRKKPRIEDAFDPAELIDDIRKLYKRREGWLAPFPWCEEFHFHLDNIYTRLKVISRKKERGTATTNTVDMSGIFKPHEECSEPRTILIEGTPGMGKTTYCKKLVYDWATGNQEAEDGFPRFETVLLLRCRDMKSDLWEAIDDQLLPREVKEDVRERFFDFIRHNQSNVLLILDGLDEVPASKLPMFSEILQGRVLPKCRLVATARHEAGIKVRIHCDTLLEIEGFNEKDAQNCVVKYFKTRKDLAKKLLLQLRYDRNLKTLARNPLNTALLCLFCEDCQGKFPKNRGQLYQEVVQCILRRYRKKEGLPETEDDLLEVYKTPLKHLGWIAFAGLHKDSLDFEESELANHLNVLSRFGFLSVQLGGSKLRPCRRYSFLHKSFQEWFAAFYLYCQLVEGISPDQLLNEFDVDELHNDLHMNNFRFFEVLCFVMNMLAAQCEELAVALLKSMAARAKGDYRFPLHSLDWFFFAIQLIGEFESNSNFFVKLARGFGSSLKCKTLAFDYVNLQEHRIRTLAEALKANTTVERMSLGSSVDVHRAAHIVHALKENSTLTTLKLNLNAFGNQVAARFAEALEVKKTLRGLTVNLAYDDGPVCADLADALKVNTTLTDLNLHNSEIGDQGAALFAEALEENKGLKKLDLGCCGIAGLADALKVNTTLTELNLDSNGIGDQGANRFAEALKENKTLTKLDLSWCGIGKDGGADLADALQVNTTLTELNLNRNKIGDQGATRFAEALKENKTLTKLDLSCCDIGRDGGADLADALKINTTLTELNLDNSEIGDQGANRFAEALKENKALTKLDLSCCDIGRDGGADLADALQVNTTLTELNLDDNEIGDQGETRFAEVLRVNKTLTKLGLSSGTLVRMHGSADLADALKVNTTLTDLNLH